MSMEFTIKEISPKQIQKQAEDLYKTGFYCSEAVIAAIKDGFGLVCSDEVIAMASCMPVGIGASGCVCGALNGAIMSLGCFFGRTVKGDPSVAKSMEIAKEMHDWFREATKKNATCCRVLTRGMEKGSPEHLNQCIMLTGLAAWKVAEIVIREFNLENLDEK